MNRVWVKVTATLGVLLAVAYIGYQVYHSIYSPIRTETAYSYSKPETLSTTAFAVRDETVVTSDAQGVITFSLQNG